MSYSDSTIGLPQLRDSNSARWADSSRSLAAMRKRMRPRSWAVVWGQPPSSKARRAAATAALISDWLASGISAMTSSVEGSYTGMRLLEEPSVHSPLINIGSQLVCETAMVAPFESWWTVTAEFVEPQGLKPILSQPFAARLKVGP